MYQPRQIKSLGNVRQDRCANAALAILEHEVDTLRRDFFCGADQVAFVLPIRRVENNDHLALSDGFDGSVDCGVGQGAVVGGSRVVHSCLSVGGQIGGRCIPENAGRLARRGEYRCLYYVIKYSAGCPESKLS